MAAYYDFVLPWVRPTWDPVATVVIMLSLTLCTCAPEYHLRRRMGRSVLAILERASTAAASLQGW
jgi:hypothetical protein